MPPSLLAAVAATSANPILLVLAGLVGGFCVGLTGMGGGALMTPALVLLFRVDPRVAVASDLVNSLVMKPIGGSVHMRRGTIHWRLVAFLVAGSVPAAFLGAFLVNNLGDSHDVQRRVKQLLGWALLVASTAIIAKAVLTARAARRDGPGGGGADVVALVVKRGPTVLIGVAGGLIVGMTSVGSGSLMIVLLILLYPRLTSKSLVGTDLVQAVPLVLSATLGQIVFGHIDFGLVGALVLGSIPGVYLGARCSAFAPDKIVRPVLVSVLLISALALLLPDNTGALGWAILVVVMTGIPLWAAVDATLRPSADWQSAGRSRTRWVVVLGVGAPFGIGLAATAAYFFKVRKDVALAAAERS
jgi:uncharacterized protein